MRVDLLAEDAASAWERFVRSAARATCAHRLGWRNAVTRTYRHVPFFLVARDEGELTGVLPLFLVKSLFFGRFLVTAPYLSHGGVCAADPRAVHALVDRARELRRTLGARYLELRNLEASVEDLVPKTDYCTFTLALDPDPEVQWARLKRRARTAVRKAQKAGLTVEAGTHLLPDLVNLLTRQMQALGTPFHGPPFYRAILQEFPGEAEILLVRAGEALAAGALIVIAHGVTHCLYGGALKEYQADAAVSLLYWEIIRLSCLRGARLIDLGRSRWGSGTFRFKEQWAASPAPLRYEYDLRTGVRMPEMDPSNPRFRAAIAAWKRLPAPFSRWLGPRVIRDIP